MTDRTVPTAPTPEMITAFWRSPAIEAQAEPMQPNDEAEWYGTRAEFIAAVRAMLAVSPTVPGQTEDKCRWCGFPLKDHTFNGNGCHINGHFTAASPAAPGAEVEPVAYDAGLLGDAGSGDVSWWQDYIRAELGRAHEHYAAQFSPPTTDAIRAQARREAYADAADVAREYILRVGDYGCESQAQGVADEISDALQRALADEPGEAE